jgi:hypothetical protein
VPELWLLLHACFRLLPKLSGTSIRRQTDRGRPAHCSARSRCARGGCIRCFVDRVDRAEAGPGCKLESIPERGDPLGHPCRERDASRNDDAASVIARTVGPGIAIDNGYAACRDRDFDPFSGVAAAAAAATFADGSGRQPEHSGRLGSASVDRDVPWNRNGLETVLMTEWRHSKTPKPRARLTKIVSRL